MSPHKALMFLNNSAMKAPSKAQACLLFRPRRRPAPPGKSRRFSSKMNRTAGSMPSKSWRFLVPWPRLSPRKRTAMSHSSRTTWLPKRFRQNSARQPSRRKHKTGRTCFRPVACKAAESRRPHAESAAIQTHKVNW